MDEFLPYSPTKQKEPLTRVEVNGKMKKALRFRKAFLVHHRGLEPRTH